MAAALFGLVLAGGASTRMQRDKAALVYHGKTQLQWAFDLLSDVTDACFVSVRADQRDEATRRSLPQVVDRHPGIGPLAGIEAALQTHPKAAWLVVACDLPFLTAQTLNFLIEHRDPARIATAFRSANDGLPEPLCAIWEPRSREDVATALAAGKQCPRKLLINSNAKLLPLPQARALDNVNTVEEFGAATADLIGNRQQATGNSQRDDSRTEAGDRETTLRVQYYALFREQAGRSEESIRTTATTPAALYAQLQIKYPFSLLPEQLKVAINNDFCDWHAALKEGDTVVFIPPVAGG